MDRRYLIFVLVEAVMNEVFDGWLRILLAILSVLLAILYLCSTNRLIAFSMPRKQELRKRLRDGTNTKRLPGRKSGRSQSFFELKIATMGCTMIIYQMRTLMQG